MLKGDTAKVVYNTPVSSDVLPTYRFDKANMAGVTPDYSVEAEVEAGYDDSSTIQVPGVEGRQTDVGNLYRLVLRTPDGSNYYLRMQKCVGGVWTQLGSDTGVSSGSGTIRLEMVGSTLKGYFNGAEILTPPADDSLGDAGYAGIDMWLQSGSEDTCWIDNLKVYTSRWIGTYTDKLNLSKPGEGDMNWADRINDNLDILDDALTVSGDLEDHEGEVLTVDSDGKPALTDVIKVDISKNEFYPPRISQNDQPSLSDGAMVIWHDADGGKVYLLYDDPDLGAKKVELT